MRSLCLTFVNVLPGPPPIQESNTESILFKFTELPISPCLQDRLKASEFITPTEVQAATIPHAERGKDVIATAQTGTGKTLAFLVPVMDKLLLQPEAQLGALVLVPFVLVSPFAGGRRALGAGGQFDAGRVHG